MSITTIIVLIAGLALLVIGAEALVKGASRLAALAGISPLVIGLTVVAYGTSSPEMAVSIQSSFAGQGDIALGNVIGSNIFNVLFILGTSALITPLIVAQQLIRLDVPIMIGVSVLTLMFGADGQISRVDGTIFCIGAVVYTSFLIVQSRKERNCEVQAEYDREYGNLGGSSLQRAAIDVGLIVAGVGLLVWGSRWLVESAVTIARAFGLSELIVGLTIVAAGTSLPELATSAIASFRGERDIAVGNVVGSNIFNILAVLGISAMVSPQAINVSLPALRFDIPVMVAVAVACLPVFFTGNLISRREGVLFLAYYAAYNAYLILDAAGHESLPIFSRVLLFGIIPLTALILVLSTLRAIRRDRQARQK